MGARDDDNVLFVDSDNAMGSPRGDVDDAYALAALLAAHAPIAAISSCSGNTSEARAHRNNMGVAELFRWSGPVIGAVEARERLRSFPGRVLALGPLTNIVAARRAKEIIVVGGNSTSRGRWPPLWPYEFNLTHDRDATRAVFALDVPLTIFPLDVARQLTISISDLDAISGATGDYLRQGSRRWFSHLRRYRFTKRFPIYDLAAALYALDDRGFVFSETTAVMRRNTSLHFGRGTRGVKLCVALDRDLLWTRFVGLLQADSTGGQP
ncbi:MAG: hypothetical protein NVSMB68_05500 [Thermoanaerobaculia bacterium]